MWFIGVEVEQEMSAPPPKYPLLVVSRLASQGEQWLHYVIYIQIAHNGDERKRVKNVK